MATALVIKIATGPGESERTATALSVAAAACASGVEVSLWLAAEAVWLGVAAERAPEPPEPDLAELFDAVHGVARVVVCARCAARRGLTPTDLRPGVTIEGAAAFVAEVVRPEVQALVY